MAILGKRQPWPWQSRCNRRASRSFCRSSSSGEVAAAKVGALEDCHPRHAWCCLVVEKSLNSVLLVLHFYTIIVRRTRSIQITVTRSLVSPIGRLYYAILPRTRCSNLDAIVAVRLVSVARTTSRSESVPRRPRRSDLRCPTTCTSSRRSTTTCPSLPGASALAVSVHRKTPLAPSRGCTSC